MHTRYDGSVWHSVEVAIDPSVKGEVRRWQIFLNGIYIGTKNTVTTYMNEIPSGSTTDVVGNEAYRAECKIRQQNALFIEQPASLHAFDGSIEEYENKLNQIKLHREGAPMKAVDIGK